MTDVQFNEAYVPIKEARPRGLVRLVIGAKLASDEAGANTVLLVLAALAIILTALLWLSGFAGGTGGTVSPQERARLEAMTP